MDAIPCYLARPIRLLCTRNRANLRLDLLAWLTVAVIWLPQSIAFALIAKLSAALLATGGWRLTCRRLEDSDER